MKKIENYIQKIIDYGYFNIKFTFYNKNIKRKGQCKYLIFNGPNHGNLGDHAILFAEKELLKEKGIFSFEILSHQIEYFIKKYKNIVNENDIVMITGGGNLGTLWEHEQIGVNKVIETFNGNRIIIFPQTIYYARDRHSQYRLKVDKKIYSNCKNLIVCCRDKKTYEFCKTSLEVSAKYTSDIATYLNYSNNNYDRNGIMFCFRLDKEKVLSNNEINKIKNIVLTKFENEDIKYIDTVLPGKFSFNKGKRRLFKLLKEIAHAKLFITDRLHGMIFAAITGTPCISLANSSGKVKGVYEWISKENIYVKFAETSEDIEKLINSIDFNKRYFYKNDKMKKTLEDII